MENTKTQAAESLSKLLSIILRKCLAEKSISRSTLDKVTSPIGKMDWPEKGKRAEELIHILETSKTEAEILERAEQLD